MGRAWSEHALWLAGVLTALCACSSTPQTSARDAADANDTGRTLAAKNASERELLERLPRLPSGSVSKLGSTVVVADAPYTAASGRTCRSLRVGADGAPRRERLACSDGKAWFFVPDVFASAGE
jgi:hypothetical protein